MTRKKRKHSSRWVVLTALIIAVGLPLTRHQVKARDYIESLAPGQVLEAVPRYNRGLFNNTRVLLISYSKAGATGVVLNEPVMAGLTRYSEQPQLTWPDAPRELIYWGGPVALSEPYRIMLDRADGNAAPLSFTMVGLDLPHDHGVGERIFMGYSGWSAGQLEREIRQGGWRLLPSQQLPDSPLIDLLQQKKNNG